MRRALITAELATARICVCVCVYVCVCMYVYVCVYECAEVGLDKFVPIILGRDETRQG